jgi:lipopolysaccharide/colanic/teichoic acid biosynthesis glycosyltransferase
MKRLFDLVLLIVSFPFWGSVILVCYIFNIFFEGSPGFYSSIRHVGNGKNITVYKFRVMKKDIDKKLNRSTVSSDDTLFLNLPTNRNIYTKFGLILERFGITELPQFFSVIKGDMSIVGARPLPNDVYNGLKEKFPNTAVKRYDSKCGLTGIPQLVGRDFISDEKRLNLEATYCVWTQTNYSFIVDFKIILYTILIVLGFKKKASIDEALNLLK